jgi:hypothetical protein
MSLIPFLAYLVIANPAMYKATRGVFGAWVSTPEGAATFKGLLLHALVYVTIVGFLMRALYTRGSGFGYGIDGLTRPSLAKTCRSPMGCQADD